MCARFQDSPRESHLKATKRILMYLKHTQNIGLWYPKGARFELVGYSDSDYAGCKVERNSTLGTCQLFKIVPLLCDNESAIKLTNNPVQRARTKHIDVRHYFIRDHQQKGDICIESVGTEDKLADIFIKPLDEKRFCKLRNELNILDFSNMC